MFWLQHMVYHVVTYVGPDTVSGLSGVSTRDVPITHGTLLGDFRRCFETGFHASGKTGLGGGECG